MHDAVEVHFDLGLGIRHMNTLYADNVADWFGGDFSRQLYTKRAEFGVGLYDGGEEYKAYGLSYGNWLQSGDGSFSVANHEEAGPSPNDRNAPGWLLWQGMSVW